MSLYSSSVKRPVTTILVFVAIVIMGLFSLKKLPIDLMPDIDTNYHLQLAREHLDRDAGV